VDGPSGKEEGVGRSTKPWWSTAGRGWGTKDEARTDRFGSAACVVSQLVGDASSYVRLGLPDSHR